MDSKQKERSRDILKVRNYKIRILIFQQAEKQRYISCKQINKDVVFRVLQKLHNNEYTTSENVILYNKKKINTPIIIKLNKSILVKCKIYSNQLFFFYDPLYCHIITVQSMFICFPDFGEIIVPLMLFNLLIILKLLFKLNLYPSDILIPSFNICKYQYDQYKLQCNFDKFY